MIVRELNALIRDANYLLVLTPIVNYAYLYTLLNSSRLLILTIFACIVCAFFLNFTRGYPETDESDSDSVPRYAAGIYILILITWVMIWAYSTFRMYEFIGGSDLAATALFFGSIAWATMLTTHFLLGWWIDGYSNPMYDIGE
jgi:hypothetical protein